MSADDKFDIVDYTRKFFGVEEKKEEGIVLSGTMHNPAQGNLPIDEYSPEKTISDAEREAVLKAGAMLSLADYVEARRLDAVGTTVRANFTLAEMDLIAHALRVAADE